MPLGFLRAGWAIKRLNSGSASARRAAAERLGALGSSRAIEPLIRALGDGDKEVRKAAALALAKLGETTWKRDVDGGPTADIRRLGASDDPRAVLAIIRALEVGTDFMRRDAARLLCNRKDPRAVGPLVKALDDDDRDVRRNAVDALEELPSDRTLAPLLKALGHGSARVRSGAVHALRRVRDDRVVRGVAAALEDRDTEVRRAAAAALRHPGFRVPRVVGPLLAALGDDDAGVREHAQQALGAMKPETTVEPLTDALASDAPAVRLGAVAVLGELGDPRATAPLIRAMGDGQAQVRDAAAKAVRDTKDRNLCKLLIEALGDESAELRAGAAEVLGWRGEAPEAGATAPLTRALQDPSEAVRKAAAETLASPQFAGRAAEALFEVLGDPEPGVRAAAVKGVRAAEDPRIPDALIRCLGDADPRVRRAAASALGDRADERALVPLVETLSDDNPHVRKIAARALNKVLSAERQDLGFLLVDGGPAPYARQREAVAADGDCSHHAIAFVRGEAYVTDVNLPSLVWWPKRRRALVQWSDDDAVEFEAETVQDALRQWVEGKMEAREIGTDLLGAVDAAAAMALRDTVAAVVSAGIFSWAMPVDEVEAFLASKPGAEVQLVCSVAPGDKSVALGTYEQYRRAKA